MPSLSDLQMTGLVPVVSNGLVNAYQPWTKSGILYGFNCLNFDTNPNIILLIDASVQPVNGAVTPLDFVFVAAASGTTPGAAAYSMISYGLSFRNGLWIMGSTGTTTPFTLTLATATKLAFSAKGQTG